MYLEGVSKSPKHLLYTEIAIVVIAPQGLRDAATLALPSADCIVPQQTLGGFVRIYYVAPREFFQEFPHICPIPE